MTFLPIVARELRVASRRTGTYAVRTAAVLLVLLIGVWFFIVLEREPTSERSRVLFGFLTGTATLFALLSGVRSTADCMSQEKREGTLGLLFLTDLKGYDVVLGKLAATSLNSFYGLIGILPMLAIPLLMGGIGLDEFGRMALVALNTLFFSLTLGLCVSVFSRSGRKAIGLTFLFLALFTVGLPVLGSIIGFYHGFSEREFFWFCLTSPLFSFISALEDARKNAPGWFSYRFWLSTAVIHGLSWLLFIVASLYAPRVWQDRPAGVARMRWRDRWRNLTLGDSIHRAKFRTRLLDKNAFYWLAARARLKPLGIWLVLAAMACAWLFFAKKVGREWFSPELYLLSAIVLNMLIKSWFASEVGRQLSEDRRTGALELLLSTPLSVREILRGQRLALERQFFWPVVAVLGVFMACLWATLLSRQRYYEGDEYSTLWTCFYLALALMLVADLIALYWVGLWQGLTARSGRRAAQGTVGCVLILPDALFFLLLFLISISGQNLGRWQFFLGAWFGLGLLADVAFSASARNKLLTSFRAAAEQRYLSRKAAPK